MSENSTFWNSSNGFIQIFQPKEKKSIKTYAPRVRYIFLLQEKLNENAKCVKLECKRNRKIELLYARRMKKR